ncbi:hypothetical protein, partial [Pseudomonas syringae group genomosp. 7]|uniref:hypothetical protein n=1 Tax=Pseudomonas syringae group genomosp. 7 TaxID=251699 RepID=UPI00376F79BD
GWGGWWWGGVWGGVVGGWGGGWGGGVWGGGGVVFVGGCVLGVGVWCFGLWWGFCWCCGLWVCGWGCWWFVLFVGVFFVCFVCFGGCCLFVLGSSCGLLVVWRRSMGQWRRGGASTTALG